jgi:hypothetical protein
MTDLFLQTNFVENLEKLVRRVRPHIISPQVVLSAVKPVTQAPSAPEPMAEKTLHDFSIPSATVTPSF